MSSRETNHIKKRIWDAFVTAHTLRNIEIFSWKTSKHPLPQPFEVREDLVYSEYFCWPPANLFLTTQKNLTLSSLFFFTKYTIGIIDCNICNKLCILEDFCSFSDFSFTNRTLLYFFNQNLHHAFCIAFES